MTQNRIRGSPFGACLGAAWRPQNLHAEGGHRLSVAPLCAQVLGPPGGPQNGPLKSTPLQTCPPAGAGRVT